MLEGIGILRRIEELIFKSQTPVPEYPISAIEPNALLINTFDTTPVIDPTGATFI